MLCANACSLLTLARCRKTKCQLLACFGIGAQESNVSSLLALALVPEDKGGGFEWPKIITWDPRDHVVIVLGLSDGPLASGRHHVVNWVFKNLLAVFQWLEPLCDRIGVSRHGTWGRANRWS